MCVFVYVHQFFGFITTSTSLSVGTDSCNKEDDGCCVALSIFTLLSPCLRTVCQKLGFKLAQSCSTSWDLQTHVLSMFAEVSSPIAMLWLSTLPVMEGLKGITKDKEVLHLYKLLCSVFHLRLACFCDAVMSVFICIPHLFTQKVQHTHEIAEGRGMLWDSTPQTSACAFHVDYDHFCSQWQLIGVVLFIRIQH